MIVSVINKNIKINRVALDLFISSYCSCLSTFGIYLLLLIYTYSLQTKFILRSEVCLDYFVPPPQPQPQPQQQQKQQQKQQQQPKSVICYTCTTFLL